VHGTRVEHGHPNSSRSPPQLWNTRTECIVESLTRGGGWGAGTTQNWVTPANVMSQNDRDPWSFDTPWSRVMAREGPSGAKARQPTPPAPLPTEPGPPSPAVPSLTVSEPSERSSSSTPGLISLLLVRPCSHNCSLALLFLSASIAWCTLLGPARLHNLDLILPARLQVATTSGLVVHLYTQRDELLPEVQRRMQVPSGPDAPSRPRQSTRALHIRSSRACSAAT
jgi:hypothetical protein